MQIGKPLIVGDLEVGGGQIPPDAALNAGPSGRYNLVTRPYFGHTGD